MQRTIYIDSVFLVNLVMDLFLLTLTAKTLKKTATFLRLSAGSVMGAAGYCLILCLPGISYPFKVLFGMLPVTFGMIKLGCGTRGAKELLYGTGYLFTYSFLLGGFMLFLIKRIPFLEKHRNSACMILLTGYIGFFLCKKGIASYKKGKENHFCKVEIEGDSSRISVYALIDTGNGLIEPVSGKPVAILEEEIWQRMKKWKRPEKYKIIPYHSIGKEKGILEGYEVDGIHIVEEMGEKQLEHVIIAVFKGNLSVKKKYQMILPPQWS